ncbi:ribonuclease H-like domain-containing protein [Mycena pura]|uniref:Ribonuclease H-like domain-containing protein n=1 Tax=Mycena pura TaxID=153505 RepID=A0AAD6VQC7_9AGAR|nr:ribonuclease H-like domain-containing protein [Mycena pura]
MPIITLWHIWAWFPVAMLFSLCYFYFRNSVSEELQPARTQSKVATSGAPYDAFLVFDVEATCQQGTDFAYPNEIIEFPVCLMMWKDRNGDKARQLELIDEFRSFVKPSWRPMLSQFCKDLTGITQEQVDAASDFPTVLRSFRAFLVQHKLIGKNGKRRLKFCWCSDGPWDIRDFVVKQCFISKMQLPDWMSGDVLDVRQLVTVHTALRKRGPSRTLNIPAQLSAFGLPPFQGRLHSGIDDTRNLARILKQLALENVRLQPNTPINLRRRWYWMGKSGQILEDRL